MDSSQKIPTPILAKLRKISMALPQVNEETAWAGIRWCIHKKNFAHAIMIQEGHPPNYAKAANTNGPQCILTFRSDLAEYDPSNFQAEPYFKPHWFRTIAGLKLNDRTDWAAVKNHIEASYRLLAPSRQQGTPA